MNKLIKKCTFGNMKFNICTNREIAEKVATEFPDEVSYIIENTRSEKFKDKDIKTIIKQGLLGELYDRGNVAIELNNKIARFALPLMLEEANDTHSAEEIINYAIENDADQVLFSHITEVAFMGFTMNGEIKTPKIQFTMN